MLILAVIVVARFMNWLPMTTLLLKWGLLSSVNDIICWSLISVIALAQLEPAGSHRSNGTWHDSFPLFYGVMCPSTYEPPHLGVAGRGAGNVSEETEQTKCLKSVLLQLRYHFVVPLGTEISVVFRPIHNFFVNTTWDQSAELLAIGAKLVSVTGMNVSSGGYKKIWK